MCTIIKFPLIHRKLIMIIFFICIFQVHRLAAFSLFMVPIGKSSLELELNELQYMPLGWHIPLAGGEIPIIAPKSELSIYSHLLSRAPRFIVMEGSIYPISLAGLGIKEYAPNTYSHAQYKDFNLVRSMTTSLFDEPWATSLFFGNVVFLTPYQIMDAEYFDDFYLQTDLFAPEKKGADEKPLTDKPKITGKGYSGLLISYGNQHIKNNAIINEHWIESEIKLIGSDSGPRYYLSWSYRLGLRYHSHPEIKNYIYMGIKRDRIDYEEIAVFSFLKNSLFEWKIGYDPEEARFRELRFLFGKKFPMYRGALVPEITLGFIWKITPAYKGELVTDEDTEWQMIISPNLRF